jgi:hypothetical protein
VNVGFAQSSGSGAHRFPHFPPSINRTPAADRKSARNPDLGRWLADLEPALRLRRVTDPRTPALSLQAPVRFRPGWRSSASCTKWTRAASLHHSGSRAITRRCTPDCRGGLSILENVGRLVHFCHPVCNRVGASGGSTASGHSSIGVATPYRGSCTLT